MRKNSFLLCMLTMVSIAYSQAPSAGNNDEGGLDFLASPEEMPASFCNKAQSKAEGFVVKKGWKMGHNDNGRYVAVGSGDILGDPSSPSFQHKRRNAFSKAMLDAKSQIAKYFSQEISRELAYSYGEGNSSRAEEMMSTDEKKTPSEIGVLEKAKMLLNAKLDAALAEQGIEPGTKDAEKAVEEMLNPQNTSSFSDKIERLAKAEVGALVVSKIFEDSGNVAVVVNYTDNTKALAAAMTGAGVAPKVRKRTSPKSISEWIVGLPVSAIYPMYGVQLTSDKRGNLVILSYGQAFSTSKSKMARRNAVMAAEADADGYIRSFVGETVAFSNAKQESERNAQFSDEELETQIERTQKTSIQATAKSLKLPGISTLRTWNTMDKRSGTFIVGVVRRWDIGGATKAIADAKDFDSVGAGHGGSGIQGSPQTEPIQKNSENKKEKVSVGSENSYSHESMESEDF